MVPGSGVIYDEDFDLETDKLESRGINAFPVPITSEVRGKNLYLRP